jgi:4'-phosphopantetheinyl transferase EntD
MICRGEERDPDAALEARGIDPAKLRFVVKEAYYKAVYPTARLYFDFQAVRVFFDAASDRFRVEVINPKVAAVAPPDQDVVGRFARISGHLVAVAYFL